jgi:cell division septal protein FtsQ
MGFNQENKYFRADELKLVKEPKLNMKVRKFSRRIVVRILFVSIIIISMYLLWLQIKKNDNFKIEKIEIVGCEFSNSRAIAEQLKGLRGRNLFDIDIAEISGIVERNIWVKQCTTVRSLPEKIKIYIEEYTPIAIANIAGRYFLVAKEGDIIDLYNFSSSMVYLPVINLSEETKNSEARYKISLIGQLLERIKTNNPQFFAVISEVVVGEKSEIGLILNNDNNVLIINSDDDGTSLKKYFGLCKEIKSGYQSGTVVDLRFNNQVVIKPDFRNL